MIRSAFFAVLTLCSTLGSAAELLLREDATVTGSIVRLGDVAIVRSASAVDRDRLAAMPLMPAPAPGAQQFLAASTVRELLAAQGEVPARHRFAGAYRTRVAKPAPPETRRPYASEPSNAAWRPAAVAAVEPPTRESTGFRIPAGASDLETPPAPATRPVRSRRFVYRVEETVRQAIEQQLRAEPTGDEPLVVVSARLGRQALDDLQGFYAEDLVIDFGSRPPVTSGEHRAKVRPVTRGASDALPVVVTLAEPRYRVVATASLRRGDLITASSVQREAIPREELDRPTDAYESLDQAVGQEATRSVRVGAPLSDQNCAGPMLVRRDDEVSLVSGGGGVVVRMVAIAKSDGRSGDLVAVEAFDRSERFNARVVGPREVAILSGGLRLAGATRVSDRSGDRR